MIELHHLPLVKTASMNDAHFETISLIHQLYDALDSGVTPKISEALSQLYEQTKTHFALEEQLMLQKKFPPYAAHKEEHDDAIERLKTISATFETDANQEAVRAYLSSELEPFFLTHTQTMDMVTSIFLENSEAHLPFWDRLVPRQRKKT